MSNQRYDMEQVAPPEGSEHAPGLDFTYTAGNVGLNAKLLYVSSAKYEKDWHSELHAHDFSELFYIIGGKGAFMLENTGFSLRPDDMVIVNPHVRHTETSMPEHPLEYIVLGIQGLSFRTLDPIGHPEICLLHFREGHSDLRFILRMLLQEIQKTGADREPMCQNLLNVLILQMQRRRELTLLGSSTRQVSRECANVRRYIDAHFKEPLTLDELAEKAHLNKFYLSHEFKSAYGMSPINYMIACRVRESKHLLATTDYSLSQIASFVGFSSASYFSQSFKRATGISPQEFRRTAKGGSDHQGLLNRAALEAGF